LGPAEGREFELVGDEVIIGRSPENPISIADTSMSRRHAVIRRSGAGWAISDLGSGNGTMLNGAEIADEAPLSPNDVISVGDSELTFFDASETSVGETRQILEPVAERKLTGPSALPAKRPPVRTARNGEAPRVRPGRVARREEAVRPQPSNSFRKLLIRFGGVLAIVMALGVGWKAIDNKEKRKQALLLAEKNATKQGKDAEFQEAKRLARESRWVEAKAKLLEIRAEDADYEPSSIQQYLERAEVEIPNQEAFSSVVALLKADQLGKAKVALSSVENTLGSSETQRASLAEQLDARVTAKAAEGRAMLTAPGDLQKMEQLKVLADDLLAARPDDREATELKRQADAAINRIKNPSAPVAVAETPWVEVQNRFRSGDKSGAQALAEACAPRQAQCRTLESQIKEFEGKLKNLESLPENELFALFELDRKIAGGQSSDVSKPIKTRVAAQFYLKASQAKTTGNWSKAIEHAKRVLLADAAHAGALNLISEGRSQAKDVYLRGYQLKDSTPDEAARLFKEVITMTPKDDELHQKADARLAELQSK